MAEPLPREELIVQPNTRPSMSPEELDAYYMHMLGITTVEHVWPSGSAGQTLLNQVHTLDISGMDGPGTVHRRLYTAPASSDIIPPFRVVNLLGMTESVDAPHVRKYHAQLSALLPEIPVSTEATFGMDGTADFLTTWEKLHLSHETMGDHTYNVMRYVYPNLPIIVVPTSHAAQTLPWIREYNERDGEPLQFLDQLPYEPYLLTKGRKCLKPLAKFVAGHVFIGGIKELFTRTDPVEIPELWWDQAHSIPHKSDLAAIGGHCIANIRRIEGARMAKMLNYGAYVIQGNRDALVCPDINSLPGVEMKPVDGKDHSMAMNPRKRAISVYNALIARGHLPATA